MRQSRPRQEPHKEASPRRGSAAQRGESGVLGRLRNYFALHFQVSTTSLAKLAAAPFSSFMTAAVIAIALALPAVLHVFLDKVQSLSGSWRDSAQISLFLNEGLSEKAAADFAAELGTWDEIANVVHIPPDTALEEFAASAGMGDALALLDENPLPNVIVVTPTMAHKAPAQVKALTARLKEELQVDIAQLDLEWLERLHGLLELADRVVVVLSSLLAAAVLFVIGNTIRLAIQSRRDEIEVTKLIGGSDAFVRRPFLYSGCWYGLMGALMAWGLVNLLLALLDDPVQHLATLYGSEFRVGLVDIQTTLLLLISGPLLGWLGAWSAAGRHIRAIEPR